MVQLTAQSRHKYWLLLCPVVWSIVINSQHGHTITHDMVTITAGPARYGYTTWSLTQKAPFNMVRQHDHYTAGSFQCGSLTWPWLIHQGTCVHLNYSHYPCRSSLMGTCHLIPNSMCALRCRHPARGHLAQQALPFRNLNTDTVEIDLAL